MRELASQKSPGSSAAAGGDCVGCGAAAGCAGCVRSITRGGWAAVVVDALAAAAVAVRGQAGMKFQKQWHAVTVYPRFAPANLAPTALEDR